MKMKKNRSRYYILYPEPDAPIVKMTIPIEY